MSSALAVEAPDLAAVSRRFESAAAEDVLTWALDSYAPDVAFSCSFGGPSGLVILDMLARSSRLDRVEVYYLDTGLLFDETHEVRRELERRYGFRAVEYAPALSLGEQAARHGDELWKHDPDACCGIRRVAPNAVALTGKRAWITGLRRDQSPTRAGTPIVEWNPRLGLAKIAPLATWAEGQVWDYIHRFAVPYNRLHDAGYPSLGCTVCTTAVGNGEHGRAGRWRGTGKIECGLHWRI